ncbi:TPA: RcnB family protein [Salmonella enterica subsp. diarizonae serovar 61:l,v:z35]
MKVRILCLLLVWCGLSPLSMGAAPADHASMGQETSQDISRYELTHFIADDRYYEPGDIVPDVYLMPPYVIKAWWLRNLPPPVPGSHWTWMDGTYVMVTDDVGIIIRGISGDIFYSNRH